MFKNARIKLTIWYVGIILVISSLFSIAFYNASTREIDHIIDRLQFEDQREFDFNRRTRPADAPSIEDLLSYKERMKMTLILVNGIIITLSTGAAYVVAGKTLRPIKLMMEEQNQFISDSSHELRTPIATLRAEMEGKLLEKHISDSDARELISSNLEELSSLQNLVNNLLKLSKIHTINKRLRETESLSLVEVINTAVQKVNALAIKKGIKIVSAIPETMVNGNKDELIEVFIILLDNAIKYSPSKSKITVSSQKISHKVKVIVRDNGTGISEGDLQHIFERFYRADKSRSETDGHGLGLSIAKTIVKAHGGSISVTSTLHKGSSFTVSLPLSN